MKRLILSLSVLISAAAAAQIPSVILEDSKGEPFDTGTLLEEGTPMIISFWSTACKPCIRELDAVYDAISDWKEEADFRVVAVSVDGQRRLAHSRALVEGHGWDDEFVLLYDNDRSFMKAMSVSLVPHVFVVDGKGNVVYSHTSYVPGNENELLQSVRNCGQN